METKAIDGVNISQLQNKFMTGDELIPVEYNGKNYNINTRDIFNNVSDYNLSVLFPNSLCLYSCNCNYRDINFIINLIKLNYYDVS